MFIIVPQQSTQLLSTHIHMHNDLEAAAALDTIESVDLNLNNYKMF